MKTIAERVKAVRARARVRRWEYRQRNLAHGAWDRFRAALAHAGEPRARADATKPDWPAGRLVGHPDGGRLLRRRSRSELRASPFPAARAFSSPATGHPPCS
jgi:hypothetical protein